MNVLRTEDLKKYYGTGVSQVRALDGIDLEVEQGEFLAVVGTSGSGKSTLLHMLGGLDRPTSGKVYVDDKDISGLKDDALCIFRRRKIGFVFQSYNLVPVLNVYENIVFPVELDGNEVDRAYVERVIAVLGLENRLTSLTSQLSGGQQQRVAIARALAKNPKLLLCDEPTGALDYNTGKAVLKLLQDTCREKGRTVVVITHNQALTAMADRIITVKSGTVKSMVLNQNIVNVEEIEW